MDRGATRLDRVLQILAASHKVIAGAVSPGHLDALAEEVAELHIADRHVPAVTVRGCSGPFGSRSSAAPTAGLVCGTLDGRVLMGIESMMPENDVIFSDGIEADALEFNADTIATIGIASRKARLVVA